MQRFYSRDTMVADQEHGQFVRHEEVCQIEVDRDIKAANLKTLVDMVLDYDDLDGHEYAPFEEYILRYNKMVELARGLKQ